MQHLLNQAAAEIESLRRTIDRQAAELRIVDIFAAALGFRNSPSGAIPDIVPGLREAAQKLDYNKAPGSPEPAPRDSGVGGESLSGRMFREAAERAKENKDSFEATVRKEREWFAASLDAEERKLADAACATAASGAIAAPPETVSFKPAGV